MKTWFVVLCMLLNVILTATALEVKEVRWGFDGKVVPERFNLLSVRLANPAAEPYEGMLILRQGSGLSVFGAGYAQPLYLGGFGERWVQFEPYVSGQERWQLTWGQGANQQHHLDPPSRGGPAQVWLADPSAVRSRGGGWPQFPANLFPASVAATDGLHSLILDHVPRWEAARREAFADWVRGGGTIHLVAGLEGHLPQFAEDLAFLNNTNEATRIGSGLVVRHAAPPNPAQLRSRGWGPPQLRTSQQVEFWEPITGHLLQVLGQFTRPDVPWGTIKFCAVLYVLLIGPGQYWLVRRRHYLWGLALLLATVGAFALLFAWQGRRGQGESSSTHTLAYARSLDNGQFVVTQWTDLFVTADAEHSIRHAAPHNLYATPAVHEAVNGLILAGKDGQFRVQIPLFSRRPFLHQGRLAAPLDKPVRLAGPLLFQVGPQYPTNAVAAWALRRDEVWALSLAGDKLAGSTPVPANAFFRDQHLLQYQRHRYGPPPNPEDPKLIGQLARQAMAWSRGGIEGFAEYLQPADGPTADLDLYVLAALPDSFHLQSPPLGNQRGWVLYHFRYPENSRP